MTTDPTEPHVNQTLDAEGLVCPEPLLLARNRLRAMASGEVLYIRATDPSTTRDFHNLCRFMGHRLLRENLVAPVLEYWIERGG
ncbi:MAG: sulfurtransferase TusA [Pseudomonadales bacterium]|nr:sulfurtransferase TusA [Pseudomonadales bacterium]MCP5184833.1 sulfurtransferase TusA [Pseudomonadales bacterium]